MTKTEFADRMEKLIEAYHGSWSRATVLVYPPGGGEPDAVMIDNHEVEIATEPTSTITPSRRVPSPSSEALRSNRR